MKKINSFIKPLYIFFAIITFLSSCKKETIATDTSISKEIEKIETMFVNGDTKVETFLSQGETKIETKASDEYLAGVLRLSERPSFKPKQSSKTSDRVGVIKEYYNTTLN